MTANYLRRPINVYIFAGSSSQLVYAPSIASELSAAAIALTFYEPGHYRSVFDDTGLQSHHNIEAQQRNQGNIASPVENSQ